MLALLLVLLGGWILTDLCERRGNLALCLTVAAAAADRRKPDPPSIVKFVDGEQLSLLKKRCW